MKRVEAGLASAAALVVLLATGCATTTSPRVTASSKNPAFVSLGSRGETIYVLHPQMSFESLASEAALSPDLFGGTACSALLMTAARNHLGEMGFRIVVPESLASDQRARLSTLEQSLVDESRVLTSSFKEKGPLAPLLRELHQMTGANYALAQTLKVKVGMGATYNINSGAMAQGTSSSSVRVALLSLGDGSIVWSNDGIARELPNHKNFTKAVHMLYVTKPGQ